MSVRAIGAKIECDRATLQSLWRTHLVFNERLPTLLAILFRMRRGEYGRSEDEQRLYQTLFQFILQNSQNAEYLLNSISIPGWKPAKTGVSRAGEWGHGAGFCRPCRGCRPRVTRGPTDESVGYYRVSLPGQRGVVTKANAVCVWIFVECHALEDLAR